MRQPTPRQRVVSLILGVQFRRTWMHALFITLMASFCFSTQAQQQSDQFAPESSYSQSAESTPLKSATAKEFMAVTAHPLASDAAYNILAKGGNAIDAMVTAQLVLGLVEPQSSGIGGGAFTLFWDAKSQQLKSFDGRETAPLDAGPTLFLKDNATPMSFFEAVVGGRSVGTPGTVKLLWELHKQYGTLKWAEVLAPAIILAKEGFMVSERMAASIADNAQSLAFDAEAANYFLPKGQALKAGTHLRNIAYAQTLTLLAKHGGDYFYQSNISHSIIQKVRNSANRGYLHQKDFDAYKVIERQPVCMAYRSYQVCGMGPPSSGALSVNQTLGILENLDLSKQAKTDPVTWQFIAEASRMAFADRGLYIADADFAYVPSDLLDKHYLKTRFELIQSGKAAPKIEAGVPPSLEQSLGQREAGNSPEQNSTSHFVIVDKDRNIISMTTTIENAFGSRLMVNGFLLNNELTDFSFASMENGKMIANRVEPGKRPRSSMAPTIVFKRDQKDRLTPYLALGSPGGSRIINFVATSLIRVLDWQEDLQTAFDSPHILNRFGKMELEEGTVANELSIRFTEMGYPVAEGDINSGLHGIQITETGFYGAADRRREGTVKGR